MTALDIPIEAIQLAEEAVIEFDVVDKPDACDIANDAITAAASLIVAAELDRLIADPGSYDDAGNFRAVVLVNRLQELRRAGEQS